jgi:biopolymer transport protein ExbB/biopolymer transport protein TolQ
MLLYKLNFLGMMLLQEVGFDYRSMWAQMGLTAKAVVIILAIMSAWSIGVMIDRYLSFSKARKQSREFAPAVAGCLPTQPCGTPASVASPSKKAIAWATRPSTGRSPPTRNSPWPTWPVA